MTRALLGGQSGWGKSWLCQWWTEDNLPRFDYLVMLDYKDEYRGFPKAGLAKWAGVGQQEVSLSAAAWREFIEKNERVVLARAVREDQWREVCGKVARAARSLDGDVLVVIDEAHFVAPQGPAYPDEIKGLATTGRGEGVSSEWVTQRPAEIDETIISQCDVRLLGSFTGSDLDKVKSIVDYPSDVHKPGGKRVGSLPDSLTADGEPISLRDFEDENGHTIGSEWIYSTTSGDRRRIDSRNLTMDTTHFSPEGTSLSVPG